MITLNEGQDKAVRAMVKLPPSGGFTLLGEGGTGKTTCVMEAVKQWAYKGKRILMTAPTNKAVKQLEYAARCEGASGMASFMTVHKALGLALLPTSELKHTSKVKESHLDHYDIMVMDEGSMVPGYALDHYILPGVSGSRLPLVIMGDPMQLPPVRETESKALQVYPGMELTNVERFSMDSHIALLTRDLRRSIESRGTFRFDSKAYPMEVVKPADFLRYVVGEFTDQTDLSSKRVLAWTNARVDQINAAVRSSIYGRDARVFEIGERVVTGGPIYDPTTSELLLSSDEECTVKAVSKSSVTWAETMQAYDTWHVVLQPVQGRAVTIHCHVIRESSSARLSEDLAALKKVAVRSGQVRHWARFHSLKDLFSDIRYCYCITVHRAQGSTFDEVFVDVANLLKNSRKDERNRLLYVSFSRAAKRLVTSKENFIS